MSDYGYICLDTEFINNISIIELSVFSIADRGAVPSALPPGPQPEMDCAARQTENHA